MKKHYRITERPVSFERRNRASRLVAQRLADERTQAFNCMPVHGRVNTASHCEAGERLTLVANQNQNAPASGNVSLP